MRGAHRAIEAKVGEMLGLITVSETYTQHNQNMTNDECVEQNIQSFRLAEQNNIPFVMPPSAWRSGARTRASSPRRTSTTSSGAFCNAGIKRQYLAGSLGMEDPAHVNRLYTRLYAKFPGRRAGLPHPQPLGHGHGQHPRRDWTPACHWLEGAICGIGGGMAIPDYRRLGAATSRSRTW